MTTPRYLPTATFKTWLRSELALEDAVYEAAINAAELWLDDKCKRRFEVAAGGATARVYIPSGYNIQFIHDCTTITLVSDNGAALVLDTDYQKEPLNGITVSGEPTPFFRLRRLNGYFYSATRKATLSVTGTWGWTAIPLSIVEACKIVAKDFFENRDVSHGVIGASDVGGIGTRENRLVQDAIRTYRHPNSVGLA